MKRCGSPTFWKIDKLDTRTLGTYALQAHFDFVFVDEDQKAVVVIEFDGPGHDPRNDHRKDSSASRQICRCCGYMVLKK